MSGKARVQILGGLGNQLFAYFAGLYAAHYNNFELELDMNWLSKIPGQAGFNINLLNLPTHGLKVTQTPKDVSLLHATLFRLAESLKYRIPQSKSVFDLMFSECNDRFKDIDNRLKNLKPNTFLKGYWQNFFYYLDLVDAGIISKITLRNPSIEFDSLKEEISRQENPISIHVRRGDYKSLKNPFGLLDSRYYLEALKVISIKDAHFYVFSDEIDEAMKILEPCGLKNVTYVRNSTNPAEDLMLMSECKINIIANSTFSMWGAIINPNGRTVVAPTPQFADKKLKDIEIPNAKLVNSNF